MRLIKFYGNWDRVTEQDSIEIQVSPPSETATSSLRILIRWLQNEGGLKDVELANGKSGARLDEIAQLGGLSRDKLNKFLGQSLSEDETARRYRDLAIRLQPQFVNRRGLPALIRQGSLDVYGQNAFAPEGIVRNANVIDHKSLTPVEESARIQLAPLEGINVVVRVANETVRTEDGDLKEGFSLSLLNVPPKHVQEGTYHPLFKIRQKGRADNTIKFEGVVVVKKDRLSLQGIEGINERSFNASVTLNDEKLRLYRSDQSPAASLSGVMLGLSNAGTHFGGLFSLYAVPGGVLPSKAGVDARIRFDALFNSVKEQIGVRTMEETHVAMRSLGIKVELSDLQRLRERSKEPLLTAS